MFKDENKPDFDEDPNNNNSNISIISFSKISEDVEDDQQKKSFDNNLKNIFNREINLEESAVASNDCGQNLSINSGLPSNANVSTLPKHYKFENIKNEIVQKLNLDEEIKKAFKNDERVKSIEEETSDENFAVEKRKRAKKGTIVEENKKNELGRKYKHIPTLQ